jgi:methyl-accepting chemotaxis protein
VRILRVPALVAGVACLTAAGTIAVLGARANQDAAGTVDSQVNYASREAETSLTQTFERIRTIALTMAREPAFASAATDPRPRAVTLAATAGPMVDVNNAFRYLDTLLPGQLDSANFADVRGNELTRWEGDRIALPGWLGNVRDQLYFEPAITLGTGKVFRSAPYISDQSGAWVVSDSTVVLAGATPVGVMSFSVTLDSLRTSMLSAARDGQTLRVVDPGTGLVVMDSRVVEDALMKGGVTHPVMADDTDFLTRQSMFASRSGTAQIGNVHLSFATLSTDLESGIDPWVVVASSVAAAGGVSVWVWLLGALGLALLAAGVVLTVRVAHQRRRAALAALRDRDRMAERLAEMSGALSKVAAGDLGVRLPVEGFDDEVLSTMVTSFDETLTKLRVLVGQAQESGDSVARSAAELRVLAGQQASSAGEQSAAVTETTVTIQQLAATASQIAESASAVASVAGEMLALTEAGRTAVNDSVGAMGRIADRVGSITSSTTSLGEKVSEIGGILALLDDLSDQTNLLALNAAIEAARAGEHGRGFAVVAGEVRKLAERARQSTGRIQSLVTDIQHVMGATLSASEEGAREVEVGSGLAADAVGVLEQIAGRVEEAATAVKEISVATQQQRSASDQVVVVMTRLSEVSNEYAAGSRQAAASADELAALAVTLSSSIDTFTVTENDDRPLVHASAPVAPVHDTRDHWDEAVEHRLDVTLGDAADDGWDGGVLAMPREFAALSADDDEPEAGFGSGGHRPAEHDPGVGDDDQQGPWPDAAGPVHAGPNGAEPVEAEMVGAEPVDGAETVPADEAARRS